MKLLATRECDDYWMSVSDMMAGLMMIFLLIAILFINNIKSKATDADRIEATICNELSTEFESYKKSWKMSICEDGLLVSFENDSVFDKGKSQLKEDFKVILDRFLPALMKIIMRYEGDVSELRIEGHTSSEYFSASKNRSYIFNTKLSQDRAFNVLDYAFKVIDDEDKKAWFTKHLTANGLSSSKLHFNESGLEDRARSRRVDFRIQTTASDNLINAFKGK